MQQHPGKSSRSPVCRTDRGHQDPAARDAPASLLRWWHAIHWDPNWVGAIGQWAGAFFTFLAVVAARWLPRRERKRDAAKRLRQRREQQLDNARLVTISVPWNPPKPYIEIFNGSDLPVHQLRVDSINDPCVHCDSDPPWHERDVEYQFNFYSEVLLPKTAHHVPYYYTSIDLKEKELDATDATITFMDTSRQRWRRTGHGEPERIDAPAIE
jgi:hypothetical protein